MSSSAKGQANDDDDVALPLHAQAPATLDHASLNITAILQHVIDVETSLPPPRNSRRSSSSVSNDKHDINTHPDVQMVQLPRHDRRKDATNFDDEDVDLFLVAARTSRVVGAGLVTVPRRGARTGPGGRRRRSKNKMEIDIGSSGSGSGSTTSDDDDEDDDNNDETKPEGYGDLVDPMGGDRYGPVTICCAYCGEEEDVEDMMMAHLGPAGEQGEQHHHSDDEHDADDDDLDEMITCLSILNLKDTCTAGGDGNGDNNGDHRVAIVLGTSFGRVLSTELGIHYSRGIRRIDGSNSGTSDEEGANADNSADPFEPLALDYDEDDLYEYYDHDGPGNRSAGRTADEARSAAAPRGGSGGTSAHGPSGGGGNNAVRGDYRFFHPQGGVKSIAIHVDHQLDHQERASPAPTRLPPSSSMVSVTYGDGTCVRLPHYAFFKSIVEALNGNDHDKRDTSHKITIRRFKLKNFGEDNDEADHRSVLFLPKGHPSLLAPAPALHGLTSTVITPNSRPDSPIPTSDDGDSAEARAAEGSMDVDGSGQDLSRTDGSGEDNDYDFCEAVTFGCSGGDAIQFHSSTDSPPPLFPPGNDEKASGEEEHSQDGGLGLVTGAVVGVAAGVFGAAMGAVSWGLGGGRTAGNESKGGHDPAPNASSGGGPVGDSSDDSGSHDVLSRLRDRPVNELGAGISLMDHPRRVSSVVVDPDGNLAATTDTLGRVLLIDLASKQVVRIWKGVRDASCCWVQAPRPLYLSQWGKRTQLYLAIHCRQRRTVEVWRVQHGPRVAIRNVSRDARLIPCIGPAGEGSLARCFIIDPSSLAGVENMMDSISIVDPELGLHPTNVSTKKTLVAVDATTKRASGSIPHSTSNVSKKQDAKAPVTAMKQQQSASGGRPTDTSDAIQLQLLKQQLASETNLPSSPDAIFDALTQISSLSDLSIALDLLSTATHLEDGMGVQGSTFHRRVIEHCEKRLDSASKVHATSNNPHLRTLRMKIGYHKQIVSAYDILHKFEVRHLAVDPTLESNETAPDESAPWVEEARGWIKTSEAVAGRESAPTQTKDDDAVPLKFATFAKSCMPMPLASKDTAASFEPDNCDNAPIPLIDSKRDRTAVLLHIFRPLLKDIFVFKVVNNVFDALSLTKDCALLQQYFGEWFLTLTTKNEPNIGLMVRWLQELIVRTMKERKAGDAVGDGDGDAERHGILVLLDRLHQFCSTCDDLPRAFLLAAICRQAISLATKQQEAKTYGKVLSADEVSPWDCLLRKLRVCLLITLRHYGVQLGSFPVTINSIDDGSFFSIYQWVARDELSVSHNHNELISLEISCKNSPDAFDPSSKEGDKPARWGLLQQACHHGAGVGGNFVALAGGKPAPLVLYLSGYNDPIKLAAHRALLLGEKWGKDPQSIETLKDAVAALHFLHEGEEKHRAAITAAVCIEMWQTRIRPVYRALLFGFEDVPELSEDIVAPLCLDFDWVGVLSEIALEVLSLLSRAATDDSTTPAATDSSNLSNGEEQSNGESMANAISMALQTLFGDGNEHDAEAEIDAGGNAWPATRDDVILRNLISKARLANPSSLDIHRAIVCAAKLTDDLSSLSYCVPSFRDVFLQGSLFEEMTAPTEFSELQEEYINDVVLKKALRAEGQMIDQSELEELETLAYAWGVERTRLRAQFLLHIYDAGKDHMISGLADMSDVQLDYPLMVEGGLEIACARLNRIIVELKRAKMFRSILAMLDAETCKWVKKEAERAADHLITSAEYDTDEDNDFEWQSPPLSSTHAFVLRILRMSSSIGDSESSQKAHSLSILSGSLLNAVQEQDELREYGFDWVG